MHEWAPEICVVEPLARRLIREQFPAVEGRSFQLLGEGWDTTVYLVDDRWTFRFPRKSMVIPGFRNEIAHLPTLAPLLPLPIPVPTHSSANRQMSSSGRSMGPRTSWAASLQRPIWTTTRVRGLPSRSPSSSGCSTVSN